MWRGFRPPFWRGPSFGASLVPLIPGPWLLAGFAVTALFALLRPPAANDLDARRNPATKTSATLRRDLEKCGVLRFWHWLASFGRQSVRESSLEPDAGPRRDDLASHRSSGLPGLRGICLPAGTLRHRSGGCADRTIVASLARGKTTPVKAASRCCPGGCVSASRGAPDDLGNPKNSVRRAGAGALPGDAISAAWPASRSHA